MHLSLRSLQDAHTHFDKRFEPSLFPAVDGDPFRVVSPVMLSFDVDRQEPGRFRVAGRVTGEVELTCSRCLEPFTVPIASDFDLRYVPRTENVGEGETQVEEDDLATAFYDEEQIDLGHLVLEQFQLALPMKPLCTPECKGLCPQCGTNLNTGACNCNPVWEDPRLAALKALKRTD
ncbi:MAG TPA: DUF177 domain-containing protein [Vicinamibacterales bacterium]|nr:DUF177 domain-containing protein [Vicinamibacterales bacterium]